MKIAIVAVTLGMLGNGIAWGGIIKQAGKDATKGTVEAVKESLDTRQLTKGAKQVTKGVLDGVSNAVPLIGSQVAHQADANKKMIGGVAEEVSQDAVKGVFGASVTEVNSALGAHGDGPLADTLAATTERLTASAVRGATSQLHFGFSVWPLVLAFVIGGVSTLFCGIGLMLLYMLFQRRQTVVGPAKVQEMPTRAVSNQDAVLGHS